MSPADKNLLKQIASWPEADQQEIAEVAREIESRRTGLYRLSDAASGGKIHNYFCPQCGSTVYWKLSNLPALIAVAVGAGRTKIPSPRCIGFRTVET